MTFQLLISCMNQVDKSLLERSNIKCNAIIINQCNIDSKESFSITDNKNNLHDVLWINSSERGLSKSRNLAIENATADICMIGDDDQLFDDDIEERIINQYNEFSDSDLIIFATRHKKKQIASISKKINFIDIFKVCSVQISFKRKSIKQQNIHFDPKLGAGSGNGGGEENKFLLDCYKKKLTINFIPIDLFSIRKSGTSTWFKGFTPDFFYKQGMVTRYIWGLMLSIVYIPYYVYSKRNRLKCPIKTALKQSYKGCFEHKLRS